jgi:hypothetical protein
MTDTKPKRTTKTVAAAPAEKKPAEKKAPVKAATAVKKAAAKPVAKPASTAKAASKAPAKKAPAAKKPVLDEDFRMRMITDTAYYLSVKRSSFASPEDDWLFAELLVDSVAFAVGKK